MIDCVDAPYRSFLVLRNAADEFARDSRQRSKQKRYNKHERKRCESAANAKHDLRAA